MTYKKICDREECGRELNDIDGVTLVIEGNDYHYCNLYCLEYSLDKIKEKYEIGRKNNEL